MPYSRRQFLQHTLIASTGLALTPCALAGQTSGSRHLNLYNLHTEERLRVVYWEEGHYIADSLAAINHLLRDHRCDQSTRMDTSLIDSIYQVAGLMGAKEIQIISGYRSPKTNEQLRRQGRAVAKKSFHLSGRALDIALTGKDLRQTLNTALHHHNGGVGYYPDSGFIHLDTGRKRQWGV